MLRSALLCLSMLIVAHLPAYANDCPAGSHKVGEQREETANKIIIHPVCEYDTDDLAGVTAQAQFCRAVGHIRKDQEGLRALNFRVDVEQFDKFEEVSREQKAALEKKVMDALLDQALEGAQKGADAAKSLNPWSVNTAIKKLKASGFGNERIISAMRAVARTKGKPAIAETYKFLVEEVKGAKEAYDTDSDMAKEPDTATLRFLLGALKIVQKNPELGLAVTTVEFGESAAYLGFLNSAVAAQADLTDQKLVNEIRLAAQLRKHVAGKKKARADWVKAGNSGDPECSPGPAIVLD